MDISLKTAVTEYPGVGPARGRALQKLGLNTAEDLLRFFPRGYEDRREVCSIDQALPGAPVCVEATVASPPRLSYIRKGLDLVKARAVDGLSAMDLTFFNQLYVKDTLKAGETYVFYGKMEVSGSRRSMTNPAFEPVGKQRFTGRIMPVYSLSAGLSNNMVAGMVLRTLEECPQRPEECLPLSVRAEYDLPEAGSSYRGVHFPETMEEADRSRRRFIFEELFALTAGLALLRARRDGAAGFGCPAGTAEEFLSLLPFAPTGAQRRTMDEVAWDMKKGAPMNRLVQGDVGSGKTAVAAFGAWKAWKNGGQTALMAPTEILARQHLETLSKLLSPAGMRVGLLTGSMKPSEKKRVNAALAAGDIDLIIGTHALLTSGVTFSRLALVVADEQHRFGVEQRAALSAKGEESGGVPPHVLVMSATPIPRTLALIIYGDLDVSVIDELPPGRTPVETYVVGEDKRERMYGFVRRLTGEGRQAYIVCPSVEENPDYASPGSELPDLKAVTKYAGELQRDVFPQLRVGFVHGKMKSRDKEAVMAAFAAGELDVLVSTTVIEVGVDVPNAALMIVENADRFGLSQLHQLRGRVGRGRHKSYCVLMTSTKNPDSRARLKVLASTTDGFKIAEEDLKLRGPGDFFGARQHGLPQLKVADFASDMLLLHEAQEAAQRLVERDPDLSLPQNAMLLRRVRQLFADNPDIFN